jgi:hypothetical protein
MASNVRSNEVVGLPERLIELPFSIIGMLVVFAFFFAHQLLHTGFFTAEFGGREMLALYGPMALAVFPPIIRSAVGNRNASRPMEVVVNVAVAIGSLYLFFVFPFNFAHLADFLPTGIQFLFSWINNGIAYIVLILQIIVATLTALSVTWKFIHNS